MERLWIVNRCGERKGIGAHSTSGKASDLLTQLKHGTDAVTVREASHFWVTPSSAMMLHVYRNEGQCRQPDVWISQSSFLSCRLLAKRVRVWRLAGYTSLHPAVVSKTVRRWRMLLCTWHCSGLALQAEEKEETWREGESQNWGCHLPISVPGTTCKVAWHNAPWCLAAPLCPAGLMVPAVTSLGVLDEAEAARGCKGF